MRVLFWGTPEFATAPLRSILEAGHAVVAVVTQPDRPRSGRSRSQLDPSPVKVLATEHGLGVLQPERPRGAEFVQTLVNLAPDVSVVVAYGHILPQDVIDVPRLGTLNIHASLLPLYRGAAPIQAAIRDGHTESGVTIMRIVPEMDAGPVLLRRPTPIGPDETGGALQGRLATLGAAAIVEVLQALESGGVHEEPQDHARATYAAKVTRNDARVVWDARADEVERAIRAYDPKPGAWTTLGGADVRLFGARAVTGPAGAPAGTVLGIDDAGMVVACGADRVLILEVLPAGRRRQPPAEWMRGRGVTAGDRFE